MLVCVSIRYQETCEGVGAEDLIGFFTHWHRPRTPAEHLAILQGSAHAVLAVDEHSGRVVGFVTALTDGVQAAFIPLLEVLPEHRGQGVGSELMRRVLDRLADLPAVDLTCRPEMQTFYARFGMQPSVGAVLRRH
jgi:ribosomal protein S18 acetylase RimI-like enzyme